MKRLVFAALLLTAWLAPAHAQVCPTVSPFSTADNRCASTAFVQNAISGTPANLIVGSTTIASGTSGRVLYDNAGILGEYTVTGTAGSAVLSVSPSLTTPTMSSPTFSGTVAGANTIPLTILQQSAANTMLGNWTGGAANVVANAMPSCADTGGNHLNYVSGTGITCGTSVGPASSIVVGTTAITGGTNTRILYNNSNVLGEYTLTGSGTVVAMQTSPSLVTPALGVATATSIAIAGCTIGTDELCVTGTTALQGTTFSAAITYGGVTLANAVTGTGNMVLATSPSVSGLTVTGSFTATGLVGNASLTNPSTTVNGQTCTLGASCTVTAAATTVTVGTTTVASGTDTRVLFNNAGTLGEYVISGSGNVAMTTSPSFTTPTLGAATATSINGLTITSSTGTLTITNAKTASFSNSITFAGTDSTTMTFPSTNGTIAALNIQNQTLSGGATVTATDLGNLGAAETINCGLSPLQYGTNNQAVTITAPSNDGSCIIRITNSASAGAITFSGWTVGTNTGDTYATTNTNRYDLFVRRINGVSSYQWSALQ